MISLKLLPVVSLTILGALPVSAADYSDPTWPCIQRKVEELSVGLMWPYPVSENPVDAARAAEVEELAEALALRRTEVEILRPQVEAFAAAHDGDPEVLGWVYERVFLSLTKRRSRIMSGIGDFSLGQIALAEQIDATRLEMDRLMAEDEPNYDEVDRLEEKLDWDQVIYTDRQRSITYLCETPQLIERRLFAIAQLLAGYAR